ncbi:MAG: PhzF family phenazine biosynthesis protein [Acidimicrobiales bacterium]
MSLELFVVDAFAKRAFAGNPAAVAVVEDYPSDEAMRQVAMEMNLSETAFVRPRPDGDYDLRWFTPALEVDLCGHATLAAASVLGGNPRFHTLSGVLGTRNLADGRVELDLPADPPTAEAIDSNLVAMGAVACWRGRFDLVTELPDAEAVRNLAPDLGIISGLGTRGVIFTAGGDRPGVDCVSRVFCPNVGVPEDPVTGSAHCTLAVLWAHRLGKEVLVGEQASARGGEVGMSLDGDRVRLSGWAVHVARVEMSAPGL